MPGGMYSGYQRLFLACGDYDRDLTELETAREKSLTIRVGGTGMNAVN